MQTIGDRLKQVRVKAGLKQKEMADFLGIKMPGYNRIERGNVEITLKHLIAIQKKFNISLDWLITGKESNRSELIQFGEFIGTIRQMLKDMSQDPVFLHGMLSQYHEMKQKRTSKDNGNDKELKHDSE